VSKTTSETRIEATPEPLGALEIIVHEGARKMLQAALEAEFEEHLSRFKHLVNEEGNASWCAIVLGKECPRGGKHPDDKPGQGSQRNNSPDRWSLFSDIIPKYCRHIKNDLKIQKMVSPIFRFQDLSLTQNSPFLML